MKCFKCNAEVSEGNRFCPYCGSPMVSQQGQYQQPLQSQYQQYHTDGNSYWPARPDNNLVWAILSTVFCCLPLGIYAIILASKVNGLYDSGYFVEAQKKANEAMKWAMIGAVIGFIGSMLYAVIVLVFLGID